MSITITDREAEILLGATLMHWGVPFRFAAKHDLTEEEQGSVDEATEKLIAVREKYQQSKVRDGQEVSLVQQQIEKLRHVLVDCLAECQDDAVELGLHLKTRNKAEAEALVAKLDALAVGKNATPRRCWQPIFMSIFPSDYWHAARQRMLLDPTVANLNTGSFGPLPRPVFERVTELRHRLAEEPMDFLVRQLPPLLWQARERLAAFLGGNARRLIFTANVTAAINTVACGLTLSAPGEILLTDHEYGAMHWCWERVVQRLGLTIRTFPLPTLAEDPAEIVAAFRAALTEKTRLLFFSHVLSPTGLVLPAREICAEARRRGVLTVIDGAHAPAMVNVALDELKCDFYGGNCHKWLLAPTGAGFLYVGAGNEDRLQPLQVSWGWRPDRTQMDEPDEFGTTPRLRLFEFEGTRDVCPWLAVPTAIDFQTEIGFEQIRQRNMELAAHVRQRFAALPPATPRHPQLCGFMTAFRVPPGTDAVTLRRQLWEHRIEVPIVDRPEGLLLRVSTHFYNTKEEIDRLADVLPGLIPRCDEASAS